MFLSGSRTWRDRARLRIAITEAAGAMKRWLVAHHMTLMAIADTPHSIALGSAIGIFFGFTPLYPLKTLLSIAVAWVFRCNKVAAAIAVTLHDVLIWAMPAIYVAEYHFGCWILKRPVAQRVHFRQFGLRDYVHWHVFSRVIWPTFWPAFIGSLFLAVPSAIIVYFLMRLLISRAQDTAEDRVKVETRCPTTGANGVGSPSGRLV